MIYNHAKAEAKFRKEWEKKVRFYKKNGMTQEQIDSIYQFEREVFNSNRRFYEHCVGLQTEGYNPNLSVESIFERYDADTWTDALDEELQKQLKKFKPVQLKAFYLYKVDGYTQDEISEILTTPQRSISRWISEIAKIIKKF